MRNFKTVTLAAMGLFIGFVSGCKKGDTGPAGPAGTSGAGGNLNVTINCTNNTAGTQTANFTNNTNNVLSVTGICADSVDNGFALATMTVGVGDTYTSANMCNALSCTTTPITCLITAVSPSGTTYVAGATQTLACGT